MTLPIPDKTALAHSEKLIQHIRHHLAIEGDSISFARFMELALYAPGLGYYSAGSHKLGKMGDFVTAPEISPLFAQSIAMQMQQILTKLPSGSILEIGAGSGVFARDLLLKLESLNSLPKHYYILEISAELRARQKQFLKSTAPHLLPLITWIDHLPRDFIGVIFANEVLDAIPVNCFRIGNNEILERCVKWEDNKFQWDITPPITSELTEQVNFLRQEYSLFPGYESEIRLQMPPFIRSIADTLTKGVILFFDYGYGRSEYYHPDREQGTLMCFFQHYHHDDPFTYVGLQDITAHVDFTSVIETASEEHLTLAGFTTQASFLLACGLLDLAEQKELSEIEQFEQNQAIKKLTLPSQMGEIIKVMGLTKNFAEPLIGFNLHDRRRDL